MIGSLVLLASLAGADPGEASRCADLANDAARLACYDSIFRARPSTPDAAARPADTPPPRPDTAAATPPTPVAGIQSAQDSFGLSGEQREERAEAAGIERLDSLKAVVAEIIPSRVGKPTFVLDNGQRWRQIEATAFPAVRTGETLVIRKASFGSFLASVPGSGRPAVRVRREE